MKTLSGICLGTQSSPVAGRVISWERAEITPPSTAYLAVCRHHLPQQADTDMTGIIWLGNALPPADCLTALSCPILALSELVESDLGQIAILDPTESKLLLSPDLEALRQYTLQASAHSIETTIPSPVYLHGKMLRLSAAVTSGNTLLQSEAEGWLIESPVGSEGSIYECYCDMADRAAGTPITAIIQSGSQEIEEERLHAKLRALFRSSVYGRFSILFRGILTEHHLRDTMNTLHRVFCELESEGREFNGYIPKGIVLDAPLLLLDPPRLDAWDLLCIDQMRINRLLCADSQPIRDRELRKKLHDTLFRLTVRYPRLKKSLILGKEERDDLLLRALALWEIEEIFLEAEEIPNLRRSLIVCGTNEKEKSKNFPKKY